MNRIKVLLGKLGLDCHDRGIMLVAGSLRNAGMEVVYGGLFMSPDTVIQTASDEDVDAIGLSFISYEWEYYVPIVVEKMKSQGIEDKVLVVGGMIPPEDAPRVKQMGVDGVFGRDVEVAEIVRFFREAVAERRAKLQNA